MTIRLILPELKPSYSAWFIEVDISTWIGDETISGDVSFSAKEDGGEDGGATATVLDTAKCTYNGKIIKPYIKGGTSGKKYHVLMRLTTSADCVEEFSITFMVSDL